MSSSHAYRRLTNEPDPNLPTDNRESVYLDNTKPPPIPTTYQKEVELESFDVEEDEDSPYPEVRAAVHNYDVECPANTIRAWFIGLSLVFVGATMNTLFSLRAPSIGLGALIAQVRIIIQTCFIR